MNPSLLHRLASLGLCAGLLLIPLAGQAAAPTDPQVKAEIDRARAELEKAREELVRAAEELARLRAEQGQPSPRAEAWRFIGNPRRAVLGVAIEPGLTENGRERGVRISAVTPGSGADKAGLKSGDLLLAVDGRDLSAGERSPRQQLLDIMEGLEAGREVKVDYERAGKRQSTTVVAQRSAPRRVVRDFDFHTGDGEEDVLLFAPLPPEAPFAPPPPGAPLPPFGPGLAHGLQLAALDEDLGAYFKTRDGVLVVKNADPEALPLRGGDVVQKVDGEAVSRPVELMERLLEAEPGSAQRFEVWRQGRSVSLTATVPERPRQIERRVMRLRRGEAAEAPPAPAATPSPPAAPAPPAP
ncbi:MAG TPA: PDZ domain-containing protein [Nevskiaceae bacterium]|nr:PDZ domain-containing protein [Nevskiaceae bacterium]